MSKHTTITPIETHKIRSLRSGIWGDATMWEGGKVPVSGDTAIIVEGHNVETISKEVKSDVIVKSTYWPFDMHFTAEDFAQGRVGGLFCEKGKTEIIKTENLVSHYNE